MYSKYVFFPIALFTLIAAAITASLYHRAPGPASTFGAQTTNTVLLKHLQTPYHAPANWGRSCSQYAIARLISAFGGNVNKQFYEAIGHSVNPLQDGSSPEDIEEFLEDFFDVKESFNTSFEKVARHLDRGFPVFATIQIGEGLHTVILSGYYRTNGQITHWQINDNGAAEGKRTHEEFAILWDCPWYPTEKRHCFLLTPNELLQWQKMWGIDEASPPRTAFLMATPGARNQGKRASQTSVTSTTANAHDARSIAFRVGLVIVLVTLSLLLGGLLTYVSMTNHNYKMREAADHA